MQRTEGKKKKTDFMEQVFDEMTQSSSHVESRQQDCVLEVLRDLTICICICPSDKIICPCVCIRIEDQKCVWFILEVTLNWANVLFSDLIFTDNVITVPAHHDNDLTLA